MTARAASGLRASVAGSSPNTRRALARASWCQSWPDLISGDDALYVKNAHSNDDLKTRHKVVPKGVRRCPAMTRPAT
jgi:hypothetical protein